MGDPCLGAMAKLRRGVQRLRSEQGIRQRQRKPITVEWLEVLKSSWSRVPGGVDVPKCSGQQPPLPSSAS